MFVKNYYRATDEKIETRAFYELQGSDKPFQDGFPREVALEIVNRWNRQARAQYYTNQFVYWID